MKGLVFLILILLSVVILHGQQRASADLKSDVRVNMKMPSVYITFERAGQLKSPEPGDDRERVWLRLNNNTKWSLLLEMSAAPSEEYGDAGLFYDELAKGEVVFRNQCHVCSINSLGPGKSLLFSLPRTVLAEERGIRVRFSYGWEDQNDVAGGREAEHHVYFDAARLPQKLQKKH